MPEKYLNSMDSESSFPSDRAMRTAPPAYNEAMPNAEALEADKRPVPVAAGNPVVASSAMPMPGNYNQPWPLVYSGAQPPIQQHQFNMHGPSMHQPMQVAPPQVIVVEQGGGVFSVGPDPVTTKCPNCKATIETSTSTSCQGSAHVCCCILFWLGCILCAWIPYCMKSYKVVRHRCPNCNARIGTWRG